MAIGNVELMHECFPEHSRKGTARMKYDKETDEEGKIRGDTAYHYLITAYHDASVWAYPTAYHYLIKIQ